MCTAQLLSNYVLLNKSNTCWRFLRAIGIVILALFHLIKNRSMGLPFISNFVYLNTRCVHGTDFYLIGLFCLLPQMDAEHAGT